MGRLAKSVDEHVGERIRQRRTALGLTQENLAGKLGISYQQVQKYETGSNRVSAGRLYEIGRSLEVDPGFFFDGLDPDRPVGQGLPHGGRQRATIEMVRNFEAIEDAALRGALVQLVRAVARGNGAAEGSDPVG